MSNLKRFLNKTPKRRKQKPFYSRSLAMFTALMLAAGSLPGVVFASQALEPPVNNTIMESFPQDQEVPEGFDDALETLGLPAESAAESEIPEELTGEAEEYNMLEGEVPSGSPEDMSDEQSIMDPETDQQMENDPEERNENDQEFPEEGSAQNEEIPAEGTCPEEEISGDEWAQDQIESPDESAQDQMESPDEQEALENSTETAEDAQESDGDDSMDLPEDQWEPDETDDSDVNGNTEGGYESPENPQDEYPVTEEPSSGKGEGEAPLMTSENPSDTASEESSLPETAAPVNDASGESFANDASSDAAADENEEETVSETAKNSSLVASGRIGSSIKWEITEDYHLTISGTGAMPDYRELEDYSTTAPWYKYFIDHITIEEGITRVGAYAFSCCNAEYLSLPKSLRTIGEEAFSVNNFESVHIPRGVTTIGERAFYSCTLLTSVDIPETVTKIGDYAFGDCVELENIYLPDSMTSLGEGAFCYCRSLEWACLGEGIETVKEATFMGCEKMIDVVIPGYAHLKTIEQQAFDDCPSLGKISIPNSVTKIGSYNFEGKNTVIFCKYDSYAMNYAIKNKIKFEVYGSGMKVNKATVTGLSARTYTGSAIRPVPTVKLGITKLQRGEDYTLSYKNNVKAGTATIIITGCGDYGGRLTKTFTIKPRSITKASVTNLKDRIWTGKVRGQNPVVKLGSKTLKKGSDYKIAYKNNVKVGTATITFTGKGNYSGKLTKTFKIKKRPIRKTIISGLKNRVWSGNALGQNPVVRVGGKTLKKGTHYKITYTNNKNVGSAKITITGKGSCTGSITKKFLIIPKGTSLTSLRGGNGALTLKWKKQNVQMSAYQIQLSFRKDFKTHKTVIAGSSAVSKTIKGLKRNHLYYVRIRTYKKVGSTKIYSRWSTAKSVKTGSSRAPVSEKNKAIAAYKSLLTKSTVYILPKGQTIFDWDNYQNVTYYGSKTGNVKFAVAYIDNNAIPELILYENKVGYGIWTYNNGTVSCRHWGDFFDEPYGYYKKKGIFVTNEYSEGTPYYEKYYRYSSSGVKALLGIFYEDEDGAVNSYLDYTGSTFEGDTISSSTFYSRLKAYTGSSSMTKISLSANTKANRDRLIK